MLEAGAPVRQTVSLCPSGDGTSDSPPPCSVTVERGTEKLPVPGGVWGHQQLLGASLCVKQFLP